MQQILLQTCIVCCGTIQKSSKDNLLYTRKKDDNCVNIFHKHSYCITIYISTLYKTYCFAFQKRRFCTVKAALLHRKTYAFVTPNRNYHFFYELLLQNQDAFYRTLTKNNKKETTPLHQNSTDLLSSSDKMQRHPIKEQYH